MIAVPPWKAEFLEKKKRKEKKDEVPLWKRELLKRLQSKPKKMSEEDQADIVEEHIPKVSDNIFLVHEKQHHRSVLPPQSKPVKAEAKSPKASVSAVENVIIIEKTDEKYLTSSDGNESHKEEDDTKEYPVVGIVHRLMDRFQRTGGSSGKKSAFHVPPYQRSKSADLIEVNPEPRIDEEGPPSPPPSPDALLRTQSSSGDVMTPLLISAAKPFTRHAAPSPHDHGYHHVNTPVRKVSSRVAPPTPKQVQEKLEKEQNEKNKQNTSYVNSFSADMSNLHSKPDVPVKAKEPVEEKIVIEESHKSKYSEKRTISLVNGDSLHSSGNASPTPDIHTRSKPKLQEKTNLAPYSAGTTTKKYENSVNSQSLPVKSSIGKEENVQKITLAPTKPKPESRTKQSLMKENRIQPSASDKKQKSQSQYIQEVDSCFDESAALSPTAKALNEVFKNSRTFKVTPRKPMGNDSKPSSAKVKTVTMTNPPAATIDASLSTSLEKKTITKTEREPRHIKETKPEKDLPSSSIDDFIVEPSPPVVESTPIVITPVDSLPISPTEKSVKEEKPNFAKEPPTIIRKTYTRSEETKKLTTVKNKPETTPSVATKMDKISPQSSAGATKSVFGSRVNTPGVRKGGGRSFTIDPSKFRSSGRPPVEAVTSVVKESSNVRMIIPQGKQGNLPVTEVDGQVDVAPKTGKRKLTVDQITVIGGYVSLERSCLVKETKRKKSVTLSFCEETLETTYTYVSEKSLLSEETLPVANSLTKSPGFAKDGSIGKYTPKYLLSMKEKILDEAEEESKEGNSPTEDKGAPTPIPVTIDATPLSDESATAWSGTTSGSTDILF